MGSELNIVMSSPVNPATRRAVHDAATQKWPFIRFPRSENRYPDSVLFALPELTPYLFHDNADYELAVEQCGEVEDDLPQLSTQFPEVFFAYIEADCVGGTCLYDGYCCCDGKIFFAVDRPNEDSHDVLLERIGINPPGRFAPFKRGYFLGVGSGGFE